MMRFPTSRRKFLGTIAAASGAAMFGSARWLRADDQPGKFGDFVIGVQSYSLRKFPLDKALAIIHDDLGLRAVEFYGVHLPTNASDETIQEVKNKTAAQDIKITAHGVNNFTKDHDANRRIFQFAKKVGFRNLTADPTEDSFDSLDQLVAEYDIRIAIHNHGPGARYDKIADVLNAVKGRHANIGACADLGHYIRSAEDPIKAIHLLQGRLFGIHLKDFADQTKNAKGVILGQGHLDVDGVFTSLRKTNFPADGAISIEYEEKPDDPVADIQQCVTIAAAAAKKASASS
jgi:inosose dehydratase